jgi:hypothetical protein
MLPFTKLLVKDSHTTYNKLSVLNSKRVTIIFNLFNPVLGLPYYHFGFTYLK